MFELTALVCHFKQIFDMIAARVGVFIFIVPGGTAATWPCHDCWFRNLSKALLLAHLSLRVLRSGFCETNYGAYCLHYSRARRTQLPQDFVSSSEELVPEYLYKFSHVSMLFKKECKIIVFPCLLFVFESEF